MLCSEVVLVVGFVLEMEVFFDIFDVVEGDGVVVGCVFEWLFENVIVYIEEGCVDV